MLRSILAGGLGVSFGLLTGGVAAQTPVTLGPPRAVVASTPPAAALDRPVPLTATPHIARRPTFRAQAPDPGLPLFGPPPGVAPPAPAPASAAPMSERYNCGMVTQPPPSRKPYVDPNSPWLRWIPGVGDETDGRCCLQSDHAFDGFISPVTNPFLFEDPRSLTEVRPIFFYQGIPSENWITRGGELEYFGLQARVAFTERFSVVLSKLGGVWMQPDRELLGFQDGGGFAEVNIGPKYTFLRNDQNCILGAAGLQFEIPVGSSSVFQDTGDLSLVPYLSFATSFFPSQYGNFNAMTTFGYAFRTDSERSEHFFTSLHLDFDVGRAHRFYPLIELNWFHYSRNGTVRPFGFEGRDVINFGATPVVGQDEVTLAGGFRAKYNECIQFGAAAEFPIVGRHGLLDYRLTFDVIFRY
jgi:hypothetical protein